MEKATWRCLLNLGRVRPISNRQSSRLDWLAPGPTLYADRGQTQVVQWACKSSDNYPIFPALAIAIADITLGLTNFTQLQLNHHASDQGQISSQSSS